MTNNTALSVLLLTLVALFILHPPATTFAAAKDDDPRGVGKPAPKPKDHEPYKAVNEFCNQRSHRKGREFCMRALKSDPRSASAKDNVTLLYISVDLAVGKTNKTKEYLSTALSKGDQNSKQPLISALKDCVSAYNWGIGELKIIPNELKDDPALASYDALMASDALQSCKDSLNRNKITDHFILSRHKIATAYVRLCVDIAMTVG